MQVYRRYRERKIAKAWEKEEERWKKFERGYFNFRHYHKTYLRLVEIKFTDCLIYKGRYDQNRFLKHMNYLVKLKHLEIDPMSNRVSNSFLAQTYFIFRNRKKNRALNFTIAQSYRFYFQSKKTLVLKTSGYLLCLIARHVRSRCVFDTDKETSPLFMKFIYTSIDIQSRKKILKSPIINAGLSYNHPLDKFNKYNTLSKFIKLVGREQPVDYSFLATCGTSNTRGPGYVLNPENSI